jgi:hypothetical protein
MVIKGDRLKDKNVSTVGSVVKFCQNFVIFGVKSSQIKLSNT